MRFRMHMMALLFLTPGRVLFAGPSEEILQGYENEIRRLKPAFQGFSAVRGRDLYTRREAGKNGEISCGTCHSPDPRQAGRTRANKDIEPMAPAVNPRRFTDRKKVEKWFARNCDDVLQRPCTPLEKGDFITYLMGVK